MPAEHDGHFPDEEQMKSDTGRGRVEGRVTCDIDNVILFSVLLSEYDLSKTPDWVRPTAAKLQLTARREQCWREAVIASRTRQNIVTDIIDTIITHHRAYEDILA